MTLNITITHRGGGFGKGWIGSEQGRDMSRGRGTIGGRCRTIDRRRGTMGEDATNQSTVCDDDVR